MARYWISTGDPNNGIRYYDDVDEETELSKEQLESIKTAAKKLSDLGFYEQGESNLSLTTESLERAEEIARETVKIRKTIEWPTGFDDGNDVSIVTQPECPRCGYLGKFQQSDCPNCGTELTQKQYIDF